MNATRFSLVAVVLSLNGCMWRSSPPAPSACSALSVDQSAAPRFVKVDSSTCLTVPYTVIVDDIIVGVVRSPSEEATSKWGYADPATVKNVEIIPASRATERWPTAVGDVVHIERCHEPVRGATIR